MTDISGKNSDHGMKREGVREREVVTVAGLI